MLFSREYNCLIYKKPFDAPGIIGVREITHEYVAVPASLQNLQGLARSGHPVLPPMDLSDYDWPIRRPWRALRHQRETANFLVLNPRSFCFNDPGTMKTLSSLWAADFLMRENPGLKALIVAPLSILKSVWGMHVFTHFSGRRTYAILHGDHARRVRELEKDVDFYIINHDGLACGVPSAPKAPLRGLAAALAARADIGIVIVDEAGAYRVKATRRHRAARILFQNRPYLWLLTGTPTPNGPLDGHGLATLIGATSMSLRAWRDMTMISVSVFKWVPRPNASVIVASFLKPAIRFSADLLDLPPVSIEQREVEMSKEQKHAWKELKREAVLALANGALVHAVNEAALRNKLIQVSAGVVYDSLHQWHDLRADARISEVESIIEETDRKVVIFAPLTSVLHMLYKKLTKWDREILNGDVPAKQRSEILRRFGDNKDPLRICLADPACTAHGINEFVSAGTCIWYVPTDKNELYRQGIKRLDRPGQPGPVKIIQLVSTQLEKDIYARLDRNESLQGLILKFAEESNGTRCHRR